MQTTQTRQRVCPRASPRQVVAFALGGENLRSPDGVLRGLTRTRRVGHGADDR
jgi:hypothetical protein